MENMKGAYLQGLYSDLEEAYSKWFWYYSDPEKGGLNDTFLKASEAELIKLWRKYQVALKEEGMFPC